MRLTDDDLVKILRCPYSLKPVRRATPEELRKLNDRILAGSIECADSHRPDLFEDALITIDKKRIYPIRNGVATMQLWESIEAKQLTDFF